MYSNILKLAKKDVSLSRNERYSFLKIRAQKKNSISERLTVLCKLTDSAIEVKVIDKAKGFEIDLVPDLPPTESPERLEHESGLGLSIMRAMSDGLEIKSGPEGTLVQMTINSQSGNNS